MSGALSSLPGGLLPGAVSSLLGLLRTAAWRGVTFYVLEAKGSAGRRWAHFLFPGRDDAEHQDLGAASGPITVNGIIIGADYVRRATRLDKAFKQAGPGTLIHPWLGEMKVILSEPAEIGFKDDELRVARFSATFLPWSEATPPALDTLGRLLDAVDEMRDAARIWLAGALAPLGTAVAVLAWTESFLGAVSGAWHGLVGVGETGAAAPAAGAVAAALATVASTAPPPGTGFGAAVAERLAAVPDAYADAAAPLPRSAVAPAAGAAAPATPADARETAALLLRAVPLLSPGAAEEPLTVPPGLAPLPLVARLLTAAAAVEVASDIAYASGDDAAVWRDRVDGVLSGLAAEVAATAGRGAGAAAGPWRALRTLRAAWASDMTSRIGRLPRVATLDVPAPMSAWLVAQRLAGDDPARVVPAFRSIVARNRIRHPGRVPAGPIEILA